MDLHLAGAVPSLLVDVAHNVHLVDVAVEANHNRQLAVDHVIDVPAEDTAKVGAHDHQVVLVEVLARGLALPAASEVVEGTDREACPPCRTDAKHDIIKMVVVKQHLKIKSNVSRGVGTANKYSKDISRPYFHVVVFVVAIDHPSSTLAVHSLEKGRADGPVVV